MELSPEERRRIYEEEKARIEAREQIEREKQGIPDETSTGLSPHVAGWLCYLGVWISGIIFFVLEQKNQWVRFHAAQSIVVFGTLAVAGMLLGWIPFIGVGFGAIIGIIGFVLWIILQVKAANGERYKLWWAGDIAEKMAGTSIEFATPKKEAPAAAPKATAISHKELDEKIGRKIEEFFHDKRGGRITGSAFIIAWSAALLIFFSFFHEYVAYYTGVTEGGVVTWTKETFFTGDFYLWLPVLTVTLVLSIIGHVVLIIFDRYILRQLVMLVLDAFGLATVVALLAIYPFDFNVIPDAAVAAGTQAGVTAVLVIISVGFGIGLLVRGIKLIVNVVRGTADYRKTA